MIKTEFLELLDKHNINKNIVVFDDNITDGYCIKKIIIDGKSFSEKEVRNMTC